MSRDCKRKIGELEKYELTSIPPRIDRRFGRRLVRRAESAETVLKNKKDANRQANHVFLGISLWDNASLKSKCGAQDWTRTSMPLGAAT